MRKTAYIACGLLLLFGCREPFDFDYPEVESPKVVIEGFISDRGTSHVIKVSYSTSIDERGLIDTQFITDATVRIEDDQGGFTALNHSLGGLYLTAPQYRAQEGRTYTLVVTLSNGDEYRSTPKTLPPPSPATAQLSVEGTTRPALVNNQLQDEAGGSVTVRIEKDDKRHFYQWLIARYFIFEADHASNDAYRFCYVREFDDSRVELLQDNPLSGADQSYEYELDFVALSKRTAIDFGVEGRLLTMNEEDYIFWDRVKRLVENTGGLFDAAPFSLEGNMSDGTSGELILGYFGVYRESIDRIFFNERELGFGFTDYPDCQVPPGATPDYPCLDCRGYATQENFGVVPPDWWRN